MRGGLSGRLVADLERDATAVGSLSAAGRAGELRRVVRRHSTSTPTAGDAAGPDADAATEALLALADADLMTAAAAPLTSAARWAAVARFIAAEGQ
jgi:hypothetical protein